jgi:NTE family protein
MARAQVSWGLALSGGGVLGAAHLGVLAGLAEMGLRAPVVTGTSAGGLVAGITSLGVPVETLTDAGRRVSRLPLMYFPPDFRGLWDDIEGRGRPASGLLDPRPFIRKLLTLAPAARTTCDWRVPTAVTSVDLVQMEPTAFVQGPARRPRSGGWRLLEGRPLDVALHATMAIPGVFRGAEDGGSLYVDGGVTDTLPVDWAVALGARRVIAVALGSPGRAASPRMTIPEVLERTESFVTTAMANLRRPACPVLTVTPDVTGAGTFSFAQFDRLVEAGFQAVRSSSADIRRFVGC